MLASTSIANPSPQIEKFRQLTVRLSTASLNKPLDPFQLIDWDDPDMAISSEDPRFALSESAALGRTGWYRSLPAEEQSRLGLGLLVQSFKYGVLFECNLSRALLQFASRLPDSRPEFRYALHEVAEEARHSMMFQEFVNRSGLAPKRQPAFMDRIDDVTLMRIRSFPELFFFAVLAGEIFIDYDNRRILRDEQETHPLLKKMLRIHVTEEARHVAWAESFLRSRLSDITAAQRLELTLFVPVIFAGIAKQMLQPAPHIIDEFSIPKSALQEAYGPGTEHRAVVESIVSPIVDLCREHGMYGKLGRRVWSSLGLVERAAA